MTVELRDPDWFLPEAEAWATLMAALVDWKIGLVITDVAARRDVLHMALSTPYTLVRFNGYGLHPSDYERTQAWVMRLNSWARQGMHSFYFFQHQHHPPNSLDMVTYMAREWNAGHPSQLTGPRLQNPGAQQSLF